MSLGAFVMSEHDHRDHLVPSSKPDVVLSTEPTSGALSRRLESAEAPIGFVDRFWDLLVASAPAILLGYLLAGLFVIFLPQVASRWWGADRSRFNQALRGIAFGLPIPICSCGVVPIYRTLVLRGAPLGAALAFLVSAPELGLDAIVLTGQLIGWEFTVVRVVSAIVVALIVGIAVRGNSRGNDRELPAQPPQNLKARVKSGTRLSLVDLVDHTGPWLVFGIAIAAALEPVIEETFLASLSPGLEVPLFALLGLPYYVCASGATPLAAVLIASGISPGAALAFLVTGPATNVTTFGVLSELHGRRVALKFGLGVGLSSIALGYITNWSVSGLTAAPSYGHDHGSWEVWTAVAFITLMTISFLRLGPRAFIGQVIFQAEEDEEGNSHAHHHDHDHAHDSRS